MWANYGVHVAVIDIITLANDREMITFLHCGNARKRQIVGYAVWMIGFILNKEHPFLQNHTISLFAAFHRLVVFSEIFTIPAHFIKFFRHDKDWLIFTQAFKTMPCDIAFLAKISQLFMRSADKLRVHIVP